VVIFLIFDNFHNLSNSTNVNCCGIREDQDEDSYNLEFELYKEAIEQWCDINKNLTMEKRNKFFKSLKKVPEKLIVQGLTEIGGLLIDTINLSF